MVPLIGIFMNFARQGRSDLFTLVKLRDALRSGDIWVEGSRRYLPLSHYLFSDTHWEENRPKYFAVPSLCRPSANNSPFQKTRTSS